MPRKIEDKKAWLEQAKPEGDVVAWLKSQARDYSWFLAHADDGIIWGKVENGTLTMQEAAGFLPELRSQTLQQARLFGEMSELLIWRDGDGSWQARLLTEAAKEGEEADFAQAIDECQMLWGTHPHPTTNGFTLMADGEQGLKHAVPLEVSGSYDIHRRPLRLQVRHYLVENENGFNRIAASRLVNVFLIQEDNNETS